MPDDKPSPPPAARGFGEGYEYVALALAVPIAMLLFGGAVALGAQLGAVALLRPAMRAAQPVFMARWLGGMGVRALALGLVLALAATHRAALGPLPASLGFLGVLLPLLFTETRVLK